MHNMTYDVAAANIPIRQHSEKYDSTRTSRGHGIKLIAIRNVGSAKRRKKPGRRESEAGWSLKSKGTRGGKHGGWVNKAGLPFPMSPQRTASSSLVEGKNL